MGAIYHLTFLLMGAHLPLNFSVNEGHLPLNFSVDGGPFTTELFCSSGLIDRLALAGAGIGRHKR